MIRKYALLLLLMNAPAALFGQNINSPDGKVKLSIQSGTDLGKVFTYQLSYNHQIILKAGQLGISLKDSTAFAGWKVTATKHSSSNKTWKPVYGERKKITDKYNALTYTYTNNGHPSVILKVDVRVYNEGMAYQYRLENTQSAAPFVLKAENSKFTFAANDTAWTSNIAEDIYYAKPINDIKAECERPLTVKLSKQLYVALGEAALVDYSRMKFINKEPNTLTSILAGEVVQDTTLKSPWRYVLIGSSPGDLLDKNYLVLNLNEPSKIKDAKWIKPGVVIRENSLTTTGSFETVNFAAKHRIPYILYDAGWYGKEIADSSDASRVALDPDRSKGPLDLHAVIAYGKTKNVGVILYVNRRALEKQLNVLFPLYQKWDVKGVKFGFVRVGSQQWTSWLHMAIRKAAEYHLMVDVHDEYRPTGYTRTYPNMITQEGIYGDEMSPDNTQSLSTLFTRMIAGAADNTNAYFTKRVDKMNSHASQMAKAVCLYSPWQFLYWYDRPAGKTNKLTDDGIINETPELDFFDRLPTVWDDSKTLEGQIGRYATIARKKGKEWYIGSLTGRQQHRVDIKCDFLDAGKAYTAYIYTDDANLNTRTNVRLKVVPVNSKTTLNYLIKPNNGMAIRIAPANSKPYRPITP